MIALLLPIILLALLYFYFTRTFGYWKKRNVVGPKPVVFFGNIKDSALRKLPAGAVFKPIYDAYPKEKYIGVYRMTTPCLLLRDLDVIKHVMIKDFDAFKDRGVEFSREGLGLNLFHADSATWQVLRGRFSPLFTSQKLRNMLPLMNEQGDKFLEYVRLTAAKNPEHNAHDFVQRFTLVTISACAFGIDIAIDNDMQKLKQLDKYIFKPNFTNELDMMYPGILKTLNRSMFPKMLHSFFENLVRSVLTARDGTPSGRNDFMDVIIQMKKEGQIASAKRFDSDKLLELSEDVIVAQAFVFYAAGFETSATAMSYLLYELALNTDVQDRVISEIDDVLYRHGGITHEALSELSYLEKAFDETLRKYPIVEPLQRRALRNYRVPGTDFTIEKGQIVLVSTTGIHHDEQYYPNPDKFDPERFSVENVGKRHPCAYMPFGIGPRNCIGMRFAKLQSRVCIVKLLSKFRVEPCKDTQTSVTFDPLRLVMAPLGGLPLKFISRS